MGVEFIFKGEKFPGIAWTTMGMLNSIEFSSLTSFHETVFYTEIKNISPLMSILFNIFLCVCYDRNISISLPNPTFVDDFIPFDWDTTYNAGFPLEISTC